MHQLTHDVGFPPPQKLFNDQGEAHAFLLTTASGT